MSIIKLVLSLFMALLVSESMTAHARSNGHRGGGGNHGGAHSRGVFIVNNHVNNHGGGHVGRHFGRRGGRWHGSYWGYDGPYWCSWFVTDLAIAQAITANSYEQLSDREVSRALSDARAQLRDEQLDNDQLRRQVRDLIAVLEKEEIRRRR